MAHIPSTLKHLYLFLAHPVPIDSQVSLSPFPSPFSPSPKPPPKLTPPLSTNPNRTSPTHHFLHRPLFTPLLFPNVSSDARDHCANERTFLSWLRLSIYMSIVSVAIVISFHLKSQPTNVERKLALPIGLIFWVLSLACLVNGVANYVKTVEGYSRRRALVQSGWKTQVVFTIVATAIVAVCVLFLSTNAAQQR